MKLICLLSVILAAGLAVSGCQSVAPETDRAPLGYFSARLYDLMDVFELNAGLDLTFDNIYAVAAIEPLAVGGGYYESDKLGMDGRLFGRWTETRTEIGFIVDCLVHYKKTPKRGNRYLFDDIYAPFTSSKSDEYLPFKEWGLSHRLMDAERNPLDITAELYLLFIGLDVGLSPVELFDFVLGIFTYDGISDDDYENPRGVSAAGLSMAGEAAEASELTIVLSEPPGTEGEVAVESGATPPQQPEFMTLTLEPVPAGAAPEPVAASLSGPAAAPLPAAGTSAAVATAPPVEEPEMVLTMESIPAEEPEEIVLTMETPPAEEPEEMVLTMENPPAEEPEEMVLTMESVPTRETEDVVLTMENTTAGETAGEGVETATPVLAPEERQKVYSEKFRETKFREPADLVSLARWCRENGMQRKTTWHLRQAIALDPDNEEARRLLGYRRRGNRWVYAPRNADDSLSTAEE